MLSIYSSLSFCLVALNSVTAQYVPDSQALTIKEIEHYYLDAATHSFFSAITPCTNYQDPTAAAPNNGLGMQTAAEWIRTAFHDFVTGSIYTGLGGLDASIGFETTRTENVGPAFNDALLFFSFFYNAQVSMSDLIALGVVTAVANCGGPKVPMKVGRVDATAAGPSGVPEPETDIQTTLNEFSTAGFNDGDTIALTACGHTMGGVHRNSFPQVVPASAIGPNNADGRVPFDETVAVFDVTVVNDYVHSTGDKGGPLVTTTNKTVQSDLRLYLSDNNQTITQLSQSSAYFQEQCQGLFQRMIETVPSNVFLSAPIDPTTTTNLKPAAIYLNIDWKGNMALSGFMRYIQVAGAAAPPATLKIILIGRNGKTTSTSATGTMSAADTGTGVWGPTRSYPFTLSFPATTGLSGISVSGQTFTFQDSMFVVPGMSNFSPTPPTFSTTSSLNAVSTYTVNTTVAYLTTAPPTSLTATFNIPVPQTGTVSPRIDTSQTATLKKIGTVGPFVLYSAISSHSLSAKQAYGTSMDVAAPGQAAGVLFFKPFNSAA
ncbi:hypothetical protein ABVK25_008569 [Lepraria finkii]|uniref:Peroxidase n=1 Tax=Lepraria finkii TaxID=1340010 RepID=A0ABR4AZT0_9LECA